MPHYIEHPSKTRIRELDTDASGETILNVSVEIQNTGMLTASERTLSRLAARLLKEYLNKHRVGADINITYDNIL